jgi:hypothetical protein
MLQIACSVVLMIFSGIGSGLGVLIGLGYDYWEPLVRGLAATAPEQQQCLKPAVLDPS